MPIKPGPTETKEEFISRCIGEEITAGYEQAQAAAICYSKWDRQNMSKHSDSQKSVLAKINFEKKYEGINLQEPAEGLEDACWEGYVAVGLKPAEDGSDRMVPNCVPVEMEVQKIMEMKGINLQEDGPGSYPWDECIAEQTDRYGSEEIAKRVCGFIKREYGG